MWINDLDSRFRISKEIIQGVFVEAFVGFLQYAIFQTFEDVLGVSVLRNGLDFQLYSSGVSPVGVSLGSQRNEADNVVLSFLQLIIPLPKTGSLHWFLVAIAAKITVIE